MRQFIRFAGYIILAILITVVGFIIYFNMGSTGKLDPITFVPNNAVVLIESENISKTLSDLNKPSFSEFTASFPVLKSYLNTFNNDESYKWVKSILENKKATFSILPSPSQKEELLLIIDIDKYSKINFIPSLASNFNKTLKYRKINSLDVYSTNLKVKGKDQPIHFVVLQNLLICASSYKTIENSIHSLYKKENKELEQTMSWNSFTKTNLNIYLREDGFKDLNHFKKVYNYTEGLAFSAISQTKDDNAITFQGYTSYYDSIPSIFQTLKHLKAGKVNDTYLVPSDIRSYTNLNVDNFNNLYTDYMNQLSANDPIKFAVYIGGMKLTQSYLNIDIKKDLFSWMSGEISLVSLNKTEQIPANNILVVIKANDINKATKSLDYLAKKVNTGNMAEYRPILYEKHKINFLNISGFFKLLLTNHINTREKPFYTKIDNYILFSNSDVVLKHTINSIKNGHTLKDDSTFQSLLKSDTDQPYISTLYNINSDCKEAEKKSYLYIGIEPEADLLKTKIQFIPGK